MYKGKIKKQDLKKGYLLNERKFMSHLRLSFLDNNIPAFTLYDGSDHMTRPFDQVVCYQGRYIALEGKFQKSFKAFGMSQIRDSQVLGLNAVTQGGGIALIALNIWIPRQENRLIIWPWQEFKKRTTISSYKKPELEAMPYIQGKKGRFPIDQVLKVLHSSL